MALIQCSECSAEISDKASSCPKCGAPVVANVLNNSKCGNTNTVGYESSVDATPAFAAKNQKNLRILVSVLIMAAIGIVIIAFILGDGGNSNKSIVKHGVHCDAYDDDGDGWVDRVYDRDLGQWWEYQFQPGEFSMNDVE